MAVILTTALIQWFTAESPSAWQVLIDVPVQLAVGAGVGLVFGYVGLLLLRRARLRTVGLYPVLSISIAFGSFGLATLVNGSGFLAVFATGVVLGNARLSFHSALARIHDALAWMSQVGMFLMLGLLAFPSRLMEIVGTGLVIALILAFVARPLAVTLCMAPFRYPTKEIVYCSWIGLRGAVPIILATFPVLAGVPGAERVFDLVFFIVVVSSFIPGATIRPVTRMMRLNTPEKPAPAAALEINSPTPLQGELASFYIAPQLAVCDVPLSEIEFPIEAAVVLIVRGNELIAARGDTVLRAGDHAYVFFRPEHRAFIELLFGRPEEI